MFLSFLLISTGVASEPQFTFVSEDQPAPFEGTLFNPEATAELLLAPKEIRLNCDLEIEYQLDVLRTEHQLQVDNLNARYNALSLEYGLTVVAKDEQIKTLEETLKRNSRVKDWVWIVAGAAIGSSLTYGAYRAFNGQ